MTAVTLTKGKKGEAIEAALSPYLAPLSEKLVTLGENEAAVEMLRRDVGGIIGSAVRDMMAAGASAEEAQTRILNTVGPDYKWGTLNGWIRANVVFEAIQDEDLKKKAEVLGVDALNAVGRVSEKEGEREKFTRALLDDGITGAHRVRKAVTEHKQPNGPPKKGQAEQAAALVKKFGSEGMAATARDFARESGEADTVASLILFGVLIGRNGRDLEKFHRDAVEEIVSTVPEATTAE